MTSKYSIRGKRVCKVMYLNTLGVTDQCLTTAFKKNVGRKSSTSTVDLRGGNHKKRVSEKELIKEHIKLVPVKDSHYCRKDSNKKLLHEQLTISKMYNLYKEWCANNGHEQQKRHMYKEVFLTHFNLSFFKRKKNTCAQYTGYENSCVSKDEKRLIFREADMMREMSMEDLLSYDVSEIDLFYEDGQAVKLPPKGIEKDFINERWAICRARNDHGNKILMDNIEECYYEDDDESDDENKDEDRSEKSMSKKSKDTILYEWRKHR